MSDRPSFFTLLGVDAAVDDWPTIEAVIAARRAEWTRARARGFASERRRAEWLLEQLPEVARTLADPAKRQAERALAAQTGLQAPAAVVVTPAAPQPAIGAGPAPAQEPVPQVRPVLLQIARPRPPAPAPTPDPEPPLEPTHKPPRQDAASESHGRAAVPALRPSAPASTWPPQQLQPQVEVHPIAQTVREARQALAPVTGLRATTSGGNIVVFWDWPPTLEAVVLRDDANRYALEPMGGPASVLRVTRHEYERRAGFELRDPARGTHYVTVFAHDPGSGAYAEPACWLEVFGSTIDVAYELRARRTMRLWGPLEAAWVELTCAAKGLTDLVLENVQVVAQAGRVPISASEGTFLVEVPSLRFREGHARIELPTAAVSEGQYIKLFFRDPAAARLHRLLPNALDRLRV